MSVGDYLDMIIDVGGAPTHSGQHYFLDRLDRSRDREWGPSTNALVHYSLLLPMNVF